MARVTNCFLQKTTQPSSTTCTPHPHGVIPRRSQNVQIWRALRTTSTRRSQATGIRGLLTSKCLRSSLRRTSTLSSTVDCGSPVRCSGRHSSLVLRIGVLLSVLCWFCVVPSSRIFFRARVRVLTANHMLHTHTDKSPTNAKYPLHISMSRLDGFSNPNIWTITEKTMSRRTSSTERNEYDVAHTWYAAKRDLPSDCCNANKTNGRK